ncbi:hypothetical protein [Clostridium estertheticum]|uniref:hypothetical protein n=1 Tax=Clostridium estertheticum TaxID=238834 RepID=UPI001C0E0F16|nr:hypothetical protein [Clostridium estertheticum]MBU3186666.1 hypothetical protein [Clostridium estertheticum]
MSKKLTLEEVINKVKVINPNIKILSKEYINISTKLECECLIDGHRWGVSLNAISSKGRGCPVCGGSIRLTIEDVKENISIISPSVEILSNIYKNAGTDLQCKCKIDGYIWTTTYRSLRAGKGCPKCGGSIKLTLEDVKERLKIINPNIEILSKTYINAHEPLECKCLIDGNIFTPPWNSLQHGVGCSVCYFKSRRGENNNKWKGGITQLTFYLRHHLQQWRVDSFIKYNSRCDITGSNKECQIHHFHNFSDILIETLEVLNLPIYQQINKYTIEELESIENMCTKIHYDYGLGVCLCKEEHKLFHSAYGIKNNTKEQYDKFRRLRLRQIHNIPVLEIAI